MGDSPQRQRREGCDSGGSWREGAPPSSKVGRRNKGPHRNEPVLRTRRVDRLRGVRGERCREPETAVRVPTEKARARLCCGKIHVQDL